jgi:hypothetical protein
MEEPILAKKGGPMVVWGSRNRAVALEKKAGGTMQAVSLTSSDNFNKLQENARGFLGPSLPLALPAFIFRVS